MSDTTTQIAARLPVEYVNAIDATASEDHRNRTGQLAELVRIGLAERDRLKQLERAAAHTTTANPGPVDANADHLAEHRRLADKAMGGSGWRKGIP